MLAHPRRLVASALAIVLGVAFVAAALLLGDSLTGTIERSAAGSVRDAAIVVSRPNGSGGPTDGRPITSAYVDAVRHLPGVTDARASISRILVQDLGARRAAAGAVTTPDLGSGAKLLSGRLPSAPGEVAVNASLADSRSVTVGQDIRLGREWTGPTEVAHVVGVISPAPSDDRGGLPSIYASNSDLIAWTGQKGYDEVQVVAAQADPDRLRTTAAALPGADGLTVRTGPEEAAARVRTATNDTAVITGLLLGFAAISVLVSAIVIANTLTILVAQRVREHALLRCVGATRRQVFRSVIVDALVLSALASLVGLAVGFAVVAVIARLTQGTTFELMAPRPAPVAVAVPLLVGVLTTVLAAVVPARHATRVPPLAALRPEAAVATPRAGRVRTVLGAVVTVGGLALLFPLAMHHALLPAILAGALSVIGVLMLAPVVVPAAARVVGAAPIAMAGLPGRLAVDNSRRNPGRAAATASALFVGVMLITLMSVGAASGSASADAELDRRVPIDAIVTSQRDLPVDILQRVRNSPVVAAATSQARADVRLESLDPSARVTTLRTTVTGVGPEAASVVRLRGFLDGISEGSIVVDSALGLPDGSRVTVRGTSGTVTLSVVSRTNGPEVPMMSLDTLSRIEPTRQLTIWARYADGRNPVLANERLSADLAGIPGVQIGGAAAQRAEFERIVRTVLLVVTGLLGVAVVIALVGIGNTLGLSVLERTRESGLLRALGLTRRQLRRMLGIEAVVLAAVGTLLGVGLGIVYGIAGAHALFGREIDVVVAIPWLQLALVTAVALTAGWLASVLPARRAATVSPSAALATE